MAGFVDPNRKMDQRSLPTCAEKLGPNVVYVVLQLEMFLSLHIESGIEPTDSCPREALRGNFTEPRQCGWRLQTSLELRTASEALRRSSPRAQGVERRREPQRGQRSRGSSRRAAARLGDVAGRIATSLPVRNSETGAKHFVSGCLSSATAAVMACSHSSLALVAENSKSHLVAVARVMKVTDRSRIVRVSKPE